MNVEASWWVPASITALDLLPLVVRDGRLRRLSEGLGATCRWLLILAAFGFVAFPTWAAAAYVVSTAAYFWERNQRIRAGRRWEYGWLHCLEHVAVWVFLLVVNAPVLDRPRSWTLHMGVLAVVALGLTIAGIVTNAAIFRSLERELPPWFDPGLREALREKSRANTFSHRLQHYIVKPFTPKMVNRRVQWPDIEGMVASIAVGEPFDAVVGVTSGGAFIAGCVAARLGIASAHYVESRFWSRMPLHRNLLASLRYYAGAANDTEVRFLGGDVDLSGQKVLLVDDSVCTGATLAAAARLCRARGAAEVKTLALFVDPAHPTDYFYERSKTPLVWPWGWEAD